MSDTDIRLYEEKFTEEAIEETCDGVSVFEDAVLIKIKSNYILLEENGIHFSNFNGKVTVDG